MCASFMIQSKVTRAFPLALRAPFDETDLLVTPHRLAPVIVAREGAMVATPMKFSLLPRWAKESKIKFATHNARLESIIEKPTWRDSFKKRHCIVPMTSFIEPIYEGGEAGHMVSFHRSDIDWLMAAGIWDEWTNKETGEVIESFSIITSTPLPFVEATGHDRSPLFLGIESAKVWLKSETGDPDWLLANAENPTVTASRFRPMKPGWEKRR